MTEPRNIALLLTGPGTGAIAVVRIHGPLVAAFLRACFSRTAVPGRAVHGDIRDGEKVIDDAVVVVGDESAFADLNVHGGTWVVHSIFELARKQGFEVQNGPSPVLSPLAVDAENPIEREVLQYLPLARTEAAIRMLLAQPAAWARFIESGPGPEEISGILNDRRLYWSVHLPHVAIVGIPNVGKSTLANRLFAQERSITADLPGTTRDWVGEIANLDGLAVMLLDTPGVRETEDPIESAAIARSQVQVRRADLVIAVLDATVPLERQQHLIDETHPSLLVINKTDRAHSWELAGVRAIHTVGATGEGVDAMRRAIRAWFDGEGCAVHRPGWWTERQRAVLESALEDPAALCCMIHSQTL